jgi:two-component system, cell cycle sensor histidine kinase and response regulator CckA
MHPSSNGHGPETILVVEDAMSIRRCVQKLLEADGFEVLTASDGVEALQLAADYPRKIDLLLSDVSFPEISGPELAKQLKELRPAMKVLLMHGYAQGMFVLNYGWYFIQKPFIPAALVGRIRDTLKTDVPDQGTDHYDTRL